MQDAACSTSPCGVYQRNVAFEVASSCAVPNCQTAAGVESCALNIDMHFLQCVSPCTLSACSIHMQSS